MLAALLKAHHDLVHILGQHLGGQAGLRIGLVDGGRNAPAGGLPHHGVGGVAAGAYHQIGPEFVQNGPGLPLGAAQVLERRQVMFDRRAAEGAVKAGDGDRLDRIALPGHQRGLHTAVGAHKEHLGILPLAEHPRQGDRRIDMACGAAAGKEHFHGRYLPKFSEKSKFP